MTFRNVYTRVILMLEPEQKLALLLVLANAGVAILSLIEPLLLGKIIDIISPDGGAININYKYFTVMFALWSILGIITIYMGVKIILHSDQLSQRRRLATIYDFTNHALQLPITYYEQNPSNKVYHTLLEGSLILWNLWFSFFRENCASLILLIFLSPITIIMNWRLSIPLILTVFFTYYAFALSLLKAERLQISADRKNSLIMDRVSDLLTNVKLVQAFDHTNSEMHEIKGRMSAFMDIQGPLLRFWSFIVMTNRGASMGAMILIFAVGIWLNHNQQATIGEIVGFSAIAQIMMGRLDSVSIFISTAIQQKQKIENLFDILDVDVNKLFINSEVKKPIKLIGDIVFDNVSFAYPDGTLALREISFRARPKTITAIVGKSGSGKTTLSNLLCKFYEPCSGKILIDGIDISELQTSILRANIGIMFQDPSVLERSFEDNVKFGSETKSWTEIENAMRLASIYEAYEKDRSRIHPTGTIEIAPHLSGGEQQRLALARILLKNPPIIILDEPTSSIDSITEREIQEALERTLKDKTAIIIAHRLSTIKNADQIIVMNDGSIVEIGTFDELVKKGQYFSKLLKYQISMSKSEKEFLNDNII